MLSDAAINLLIQIPLAGVVVVVVIVFLNFIGKYSANMMAFLDTQQKLMQKFIEEQREQSNLAMGRLAEEIKQVGHEVARLNGVVMAHDAASKERSERGRK